MNIEEKVKMNLIARGFGNETMLNNKGLIGATIDETILEVVKNLRIADVVGQSEQLVCVGCGRTEQKHTGNGKDICPNYGGRFKAN